jgi:hypothetical protein
MWKPRMIKQPGRVAHITIRLDATTVNAHLAILRELNAPPSVISIAERLAAATSLQVGGE